MQDGEGWVGVDQGVDQRRLRASLLVLQALQVPHRKRHAADGSWVLEVPARWQETARRELAEVRAERPLVHSLPLPTWPVQGHALTGAALYSLVLLTVWQFQSRGLFRDWTAAGILDAERFRQGEWWRAVTALTLHADGGHLVSNLVFGSLFGFFLARTTGAGTAWLSSLCAGALGNAWSVWTRTEEYRALGASTAVFGAVGILAAHVWARRRRYIQDRWRRRAPLVVGAVLLGLYGGSGVRTDIWGHVSGFLAGLFLGLILSRREPSPGRPDPTGSHVQAFRGLLALVGLAICWTLALWNHGPPA